MTVRRLHRSRSRGRLMSYHLDCQVCRYQVEVADASAKIDNCPECGSFFAMMPVTVRPRTTVATVLRHSDPELLVPTTPPAASPSPAGPLSHEGRGGEKPLAPAPQRPSSPSPLPQSRERAEEAPAIPKGVLVDAAQTHRPLQPKSLPVHPAPPRPIVTPSRPFEEPTAPKFSALTDPAGPGALLVGLAALSFIWIPRLSGLVVPLAFFGLLWGVIAMMVAASVGRPRGRAALGTALSLTAFGIAVFPTSMFRSTAAPVAAPVVTASTWTDASRGEQKLGGASVEVVSVELGTADAPPAPPAKGAAPVKATPTREKVVIVRLRGKRSADASAADKSAGIWREKPRATLGDDSGHKLALRSAGIPAAAEAVLVFEAPPRIRKFLRLEVPATALGGTGTFRFLIPTGMVRADIADTGTKPGA